MAQLKEYKFAQDAGYYESVLNSIEDYAVFTTDKDGVVNSWNTGAKQVLGYQAEDILGINAAIFFTPDDLKKSADKIELKTAKKYGRAIDERYHVRQDKTVFWASGKMFPLFDSKGKHLGFTKVMRNLDDRKRSEEQFNQVKEYADAIVSNSRQPILVLTKDLNIYTASGAFYQLFKLNKKGSQNQSITKVKNGLFNIPELAELLMQVSGVGKAIENFKLDYEWPKIGKKVFLINANKLQHQVDSQNLILFSIEDVTERISLEKQKDDFISIASHEIRTPITVIKAYAQILKKRATEVNDHFLADTAGKVNEKTEKLLLMVKYLLDTSQLELGVLIIKKTRFDIMELVNESVDELKLIDQHPFNVKGSQQVEVMAGWYI